MTQHSVRPTPSFVASPLLIPSASYECHSWTGLARELEHDITAPSPLSEIASTTTTPRSFRRDRPSPLMMAAGVLTAVLLGSASLVYAQQSVNAVLQEASADFAYRN
ncbi:MAG: hypothetical protein AAF889_02745 [Cyanobacteria bacterium P01_D01_bin.73]